MMFSFRNNSAWSPVILLCILVPFLFSLESVTAATSRRFKGVKNGGDRRLHSSGKGGKGNTLARTGVTTAEGDRAGFFATTNSEVEGTNRQAGGSGKGGKGGGATSRAAANSHSHSHSSSDDAARAYDAFPITGVAASRSSKAKAKAKATGRAKKGKAKNKSRSGKPYDKEARYGTISTSTLPTYDNKCDAAEAGAEYRTESFVTMYYEYEMLTNSTRNALEMADIVDKAVQHFLAVWLVDCNFVMLDKGNDRRLLSPAQRSGQFSRAMQAVLAPVMGTGVGEYDTVLLSGAADEECKNLVAAATMNQACYKVIGSTVIYLDPDMEVKQDEVVKLAEQTLTVGMNYASTDFTQLDSDLYGLWFVKNYGLQIPEQFIATNWEANQRPWDISQGSPTTFASAQSIINNDNGGRSGGAKFGIAFAALLCASILVFMSVYFYRNRDRYSCDSQPWEFRKSGRHYTSNFSDDDTVPTKCDDRTSVSSQSRRFKRFSLASLTPETTQATPDPETPCTNNSRMRGSRDASFSVQESNIVTPHSHSSNWSTSPSQMSDVTSTCEVRNRISPTKRSRGGRSGNLSPGRTYRIDDTVDL